MAGVPITLSQTKPDFESLVLQLQLYLASRATWNDLLTSSTGQTLIEMMAAVGAFNQFAIESANRESFLTTAMRDSSIYAIARMLGVRISRKVPASVEVTLHRAVAASATYLTIPNYSKFAIDGKSFFNRAPITFDPVATSTNAVLYEGTLKTQTFASNSSLFREIELQEFGFSVSDVDVEVSLINPVQQTQEFWGRTDQGIWIASGYDAVYNDSTTGMGDTVIAFGDGQHGKLPPIGSNIQIKYAITKGAGGNGGVTGLEVSMDSTAAITGITTSVIAGGADEKSSQHYQALAPYIFKARSRAVTSADYKAIATSYPGVASVTVQGQRDIAPRDVRWMNVIRICVLPIDGDALTEGQWKLFLDFLADKRHAAVHVQTRNPTKLVARVEAVLALKLNAVASAVLPEVTANLRRLFEKDLATLGRKIALSDIVDACRTVDVDYVDLISPTSNLTPADDYTYYELGEVILGTKYTERGFYSERDKQGALAGN